MGHQDVKKTQTENDELMIPLAVNQHKEEVSLLALGRQLIDAFLCTLPNRDEQ